MTMTQDPKKLKKIQVAQDKLFKKFGIQYVPFIAFPRNKPGLLGRAAMWLLNLSKAMIKLQVVEKR